MNAVETVHPAMSSTSRVRSVPAASSVVVGMYVDAAMAGMNTNAQRPGWK
jgi:hypothetical protein